MPVAVELERAETARLKRLLCVVAGFLIAVARLLARPDSWRRGGSVVIILGFLGVITAEAAWHLGWS